MLGAVVEANYVSGDDYVIEFQDHRFGFGVSSPLWDAVFRTLPRRRRG